MELLGIVIEPLAQFRAGRELLGPPIDAGLLLAHAPRPDAVDQHARAVAIGGLLVRSLDAEHASRYSRARKASARTSHAAGRASVGSTALARPYRALTAGARLLRGPPGATPPPPSPTYPHLEEPPPPHLRPPP